MGSSQTRAWTHVPCIGRQILNHCATRGVPLLVLLSLRKLRRFGELCARNRGQRPYSWPLVSADSEPMNRKGWLYYTTLYKGIEHPQILVSEGSAGTNPPQIPRDSCVYVFYHFTDTLLFCLLGKLKTCLSYHNDGYMSLHIYPSPQNVHHQEWTLM